MTKVWGELNSLSNQVIIELEKIYTEKIPYGQIASLELLNTIIELSKKINRELAVYIDRKGVVKLVTVGTWDLVKIPQMWSKRSREGYSGIRCIHTHPNGDSSFSDADLNALINLKLDAMIALGIGKNTLCSFANLLPVEGLLTSEYEVQENLTVLKLLTLPFMDLLIELEKRLEFKGHLLDTGKEKALLVIVDWRKIVDLEIDDIKEELINLAKTANLEVSDVLIQKRDKRDPSYLVGKGKINEIALKVQEDQVDCVIFEDSLSPSQQANLMEYLGVKVFDRTTLILDIFAQRAKTREGKLQVELAQLSYLLPRLSGHGINLSRLGGGVGTRGPGETKLETDRRHVRNRIHNLKNEIEVIEKHRNLLQTDRKGKLLPIVALVGYTNAGKSSLLNSMASDNVLVEDKLFATLDTTTRSFQVDSQQILLTDTIGFIRNLPHQLISAFQSTLEEVKLADLLLHVIDVNNKNMESNIKTVQGVLKDLDVLDKPMIYVFNKADLINNEPIIHPEYNPYCLVSAKTGFGLQQLNSVINEFFSKEEVKTKLHIPYNQGYLLDKAYQSGKVEIIDYDDQGTTIFLVAQENKIINELKKLRVLEY